MSASQRVSVDHLYDRKFEQGYMEYWPCHKQERIMELIRSLSLPESGTALDFGCGNGILTNLLKTALPSGWRVFGCDISAVAIANARASYKNCAFFTADQSAAYVGSFDLLFSHHVLEHVDDLNAAVQLMTAYMKTRSTMFHILPCGNPGSFEYRICEVRRGGIDPQRGNRFFFEDPTHLRRLTTKELASVLENAGFALSGGYYACQRLGAIDWMTESLPQIAWKVTSTDHVQSMRTRNVLRMLRVGLLLLWCLRFAATIVDRLIAKRRRRLSDFCLIAIALPFYPISKTVDAMVRRMASREWTRRRLDPRGSEMYLLFAR